MPRAYWNEPENMKLTSLLVLLEPSYKEWKALMEKVQGVEAGQLGTDRDESHELYDMELLNERYGGSALVLPHRQYGLVTGEFRTKDHRKFWEMTTRHGILTRFSARLSWSISLTGHCPNRGLCGLMDSSQRCNPSVIITPARLRRAAVATAKCGNNSTRISD